MNTNNQTNGYGPQLFEQVTGYGNKTNEQPAGERAELKLIRQLMTYVKQAAERGDDHALGLVNRAAAMLEADAQRPAMKPLTDEQIVKMYRATQLGDGFIMLRSDYERGIRDAEAAHGIKEQPAMKPLTDEEIQDMLGIGNPSDEEYRLIRLGWGAAHGIKEKP